MENPNETLTPAVVLPTDPLPDFVPPTNPVPEDDLEHSRFHDFGIQEGLSIEKIELNFTETRRRSVYGTIYINTHFQYVHTLYKRRTEEAETMSSPSGGGLTLCGPKYLLPSHNPTILYVDLRELGKEEQPFFQARVPLLSDVRKPFSVESPGKEATLAIHLTPIQPCVLTKISVKLGYPQLVSGSVVAVQNLRIPPDGAKKERRVCLFKRHEDDPVRADDAMIKLDREVFLAPLWFEKSYIEKMHQLNLEADEEDRKELDQLHLKADDESSDGYPYDGILPDDGFYNGDGSYLSVEIDLKLVDEASVDKYRPVRETLHYQFKSSDVHWSDFTATAACVSVTLQPFLDVVTRMRGEPDEHDMPLYEKTESEKQWQQGLDELKQELEESKGKKPVTE